MKKFRDFLIVVFLFFQFVSFIWGALDVASDFNPEGCGKWPKTAGGLLLPGYKIGCTTAKVLSMEIK